MRRQSYQLLLTGVAVGIVYGLLARAVFGQRATLASVTYLFMVPAVLGVVSLAFADRRRLRAYRNVIFVPWLTFLGVLVGMAALGLEDLLCLLILGAPFFVLGTLGALAYRWVRLRREPDAARTLGLLLLPFLISPLEEAIRSPSRVFVVTSEVRVRAPADVIWSQIVEVPEIAADEFTPGVFHRLGIPRPLAAELHGRGRGAVRTGRFDGGLRLDERITEWVPGRRVAFAITVDTTTLRDAAFDRHVLTGDYFRFIDAAYDILPDAAGYRLRLTSRYRLTSKVNLYGRLWGDSILRDFQSRLLGVIARRCDAIGSTADAAAHRNDGNV